MKICRPTLDWENQVVRQPTQERHGYDNLRSAHRRQCKMNETCLLYPIFPLREYGSVWDHFSPATTSHARTVQQRNSKRATLALR